MKPLSLQPPLQVVRRYRRHDFTLRDFLASREESRRAHELMDFRGRSWSYADFALEVDRTAALLQGFGVRAGDRVAVMARNHPSTAIVFFALGSLGAVMVPVNPQFGVVEARYVLEHADVVGVIHSDEAAHVIARALESRREKPWILLNEAMLEQSAAQARFSRPALDPDTPCLQIYTSGTTGAPKGVVHSQRSAVLTGEAFVGRMYLQPEDRLLCVMPMFHMNALLYSLCGSIGCGGTFLPVPKFSASTFWRDAADGRATEVNLVAAMARILMARPRGEFVREHQLGRAFIAPLVPEIVRAFREEFCVDPLIECYGMTEIPGVLSNPFLGPHKVGTLGIASPHPDPAIPRPEFRIVGADGADVPRGAAGELAVRTPTIMQGYFRAEEQTAGAFRDGWFMTGDICRQDEDGYFVFVARKHDIIRRRGENISGAELDRVVESHPEVQEAAAIAVASELGEDDILVAVVRRPGAHLNAADVAAWVEEKLNAAKAPRYVAFVASLPRTPTQRIEKYKLRADSELLAGAIDLHLHRDQRRAACRGTAAN